MKIFKCCMYQSGPKYENGPSASLWKKKERDVREAGSIGEVESRDNLKLIWLVVCKSKRPAR
jgi:hypothetical protein